MASLTFTVSTSRSNRQQGGNRKRQQKKPFCKVCFDAGKSEAEYTSHFLKNRPGPNGKVICPTLLTTECRYCHEHGHFKSHCPDLEKRKYDKERSAKARAVSRQQKFEAGNWMTTAVSKQLDEAVAANKLQRKQAVPQQSTAFASKSQFSVLDDSDDEEEIVYSRGPSVAKAKVPQGAWALKTTVEVRKCADLEANLLRKTDIIAELAELNLELQEETQKHSGAWADFGDIDDLEKQIEELETELYFDNDLTLS